MSESQGCKYTPKTKEELEKLVRDSKVYLGDIDTSYITDMSNLFMCSKRMDFSGIEKWDVSNVTNMKCMFYGAESFNQSLESWNVCSVRNFKSMFAKSAQKILPHWYAKLNWILQ